ncbi:MAG TPA: alpha/beta hydrolase [Terriglobales bacterium]|nr:alpha/beta hydrolase [Terriglobales bacterium]
MLIVVIVGAYIALGLFAFFLADGVVFQPHPSSYRDDAFVLKLTSRDGAKISALYLLNPAAQYTILFSHGNAEDLGDMRPLYDDLRQSGFAVFAYDYQGYGTSEGKPSEQHAYQDADAAYDYLTGTLHVPPQRVISMGRSLGAAVAIDLASRHPVAGLVVQSGFTTAFRVLTQVPLLPWDKFRNIDTIARVNCPVLVMHGRKDEVIPFHHGELLFAAAKEPKKFLWVTNGDHNNLAMFAGRKYFEALREFAAGLSGSAATAK